MRLLLTTLGTFPFPHTCCHSLRKDFSEWLVKCHSELDKDTTFSDPILDKCSLYTQHFRTLTFGQSGSGAGGWNTFKVGDRVKVYRGGSEKKKMDMMLGEVVGFKVSGGPTPRFQGPGRVLLQRHPLSIWPLEAAPLELDVGLLKASADAAKSSKLSAKDWKKEVEKKEKELPARLRVRHVPRDGGGSQGLPSPGDGGALLHPGSELGDGRKTSLAAGRTQLTLEVTVLSGAGKAVTVPPDGSKSPWLVCQELMTA